MRLKHARLTASPMTGRQASRFVHRRWQGGQWPWLRPFIEDDLTALRVALNDPEIARAHRQRARR